MPLTAHQECVLVVIDAQPGFFPDELADRPAALEALARAGRRAQGLRQSSPS